MIDLEQDFREVRRLLDDPKEQRPTPDFIVSELISANQHMQNRQNNSGRPWNRRSTSVTTVANQAEYLLLSAGGADHSFGKALFAFRALDNNVILPVGFTDLTLRLNNQVYPYTLIPGEGGVVPGVSGEQVAFFRDADGVKVRIFPTPAEAGTVYWLYYATGALDWSTFEWTYVPTVPEYSRFRTLHASLATIGRCEWEGLSWEQNRERRTELRGDLQMQYAVVEDEFSTFIRSPQHDPVDDVGPWWVK